ncbi:MAG: response regulator [Pseudomonadota bacterium]
MDIDPKIFQQLIDTFTLELEEQLQLITQGLVKLEKNIDPKGAETTLHSIFRSAHNIKGSSRGIGIVELGEIAHKLENVFQKLRDEKSLPSKEVVDVSFEALEAMRKAFAAFVNKQPFDSQPMVAKLITLLSSNLSRSDVSAACDQKKSATTVMSECAPENRSAETETAEALPHDEYVKISIAKIAEINALIDELQMIKLHVADRLSQSKGLLQKVDGQVDLMRSQHVLDKQEKRTESVEKLAELNEKILNNQMAIQKELMKLYNTDYTTNSQLKLLAENLQYQVRLLQLTPIDVVLQPLIGTARTLSRELNKEINLTISSGGIDLDRSMLEVLKDPLQHLLRNAIDHGIEVADMRKEMGKEAIGQIHIDVASEGSRIVLTFSDDGSGINAQKILQSAIHKKIITEEEAKNLTEAQKLDFAFSPGVSTKEIITELSGRGVGLDVVRTNIQSVGGDVSLTTELNQGTTIKLSLPLTLASDHGVFIRVRDSYFVIPTTAVIRIVELGIDQIDAVQAGYAFMLEERPVPLRDLANILNFETLDEKSEKSEKASIVVISKGWTLVGLVVDEVLGEQEIVVKPMIEPLNTLPSISGATLTGQGEVVLVLNPLYLVEAAVSTSGNMNLGLDSQAEQDKKRIVLVVDDSMTTRLFVSSLFESRGYKVLSAINGKEGLDIVRKEPVSLIVTDVIMPEMDGFEFTKAVKDDAKLKDIPVIIVTSKAKDEDKKRGVEVGADAYIVKSQFESSSLLEIAQQLM